MEEGKDCLHMDTDTSGKEGGQRRRHTMASGDMPRPVKSGASCRKYRRSSLDPSDFVKDKNGNVVVLLPHPPSSMSPRSQAKVSLTSLLSHSSNGPIRLQKEDTPVKVVVSTCSSSNYDVTDDVLVDDTPPKTDSPLSESHKDVGANRRHNSLGEKGVNTIVSTFLAPGHVRKSRSYSFSEVLARLRERTACKGAMASAMLSDTSEDSSGTWTYHNVLPTKLNTDNCCQDHTGGNEGRETRCGLGDQTPTGPPDPTRTGGGQIDARAGLYHSTEQVGPGRPHQYTEQVGPGRPHHSTEQGHLARHDAVTPSGHSHMVVTAPHGTHRMWGDMTSREQEELRALEAGVTGHDPDKQRNGMGGSSRTARANMSGHKQLDFFVARNTQDKAGHGGEPVFYSKPSKDKNGFGEDLKLWHGDNKQAQIEEMELERRISPILFSRDKPAFTAQLELIGGHSSRSVFDKDGNNVHAVNGDPFSMLSCEAAHTSGGKHEESVSRGDIERPKSRLGREHGERSRPKSAKCAAMRKCSGNEELVGKAGSASPEVRDTETAVQEVTSSRESPTQVSERVDDTRYNRPQSAWEAGSRRNKAWSRGTAKQLDSSSEDSDEDSGLDEILYLDDGSHNALGQAPVWDGTGSEGVDDDDQSLSPKEEVLVINIGAAHEAWNSKTGPSYYSYRKNADILGGGQTKGTGNQLSKQEEAAMVVLDSDPTCDQYQSETHKLRIKRKYLQQRRFSDESSPAGRDLSQLLQGVQSGTQQDKHRVASEAVLNLAAEKVLHKYRQRAKSDITNMAYMTDTSIRKPNGTGKLSPSEPPDNDIDPGSLPRKLRPLRPKSAKSDRSRTCQTQQKQDLNPSSDADNVFGLANDVEQLALSKAKLAPLNKSPTKSKRPEGRLTETSEQVSGRTKLRPIKPLTISPRSDSDSGGSSGSPLNSPATRFNSKSRGSLSDSPLGSPLSSYPLAVLSPIHRATKNSSPTTSCSDVVSFSRDLNNKHKCHGKGDIRSMDEKRSLAKTESLPPERDFSELQMYKNVKMQRRSEPNTNLF